MQLGLDRNDLLSDSCGMLYCCRLILETDPQTVAARVTMRGADSEVPIAEQVRAALSFIEQQRQKLAQGLLARAAGRVLETLPTCRGVCPPQDLQFKPLQANILPVVICWAAPHTSVDVDSLQFFVTPSFADAQTFSQAFASAKEHLARSLLK